jgi:site-specific recombinase XerD
MKNNKNTTADFLDFDSTLNKSLKLLRNEKKFKISFLVIVGINTGLRISDLLKLKHRHLQNDFVEIIEQKTKKRREIKFNENIKKAYEQYVKMLNNYNEDDFLFVSQKKTVYTIRQINRLIDQNFAQKGKKISSHSLRKTFGRRVWNNNNQSEKALIMLSNIFSHSSIAITRVYLGINQEEINEIYLSL